MVLIRWLNTLRSLPLYVYLDLAFALAWIASTVLFNLGRGPEGDDASEVQGIHRWINSEPLSLQNLLGKVVQVDFWTYTCSNCIRTFPFLKNWQGKYSDKGLAIVGVHTPEFEFEKIIENVAARANNFSLEYPIAKGHDLATWRDYNNRFWPAKYLIDKEGVVRYTYFGEGQYLETEEKIKDILVNAGTLLAGIEPGLADGGPIRTGRPGATFQSRITRELNGGYQRNLFPGGNYIAHDDYYQGHNRVVDYQDTRCHSNHPVYLNYPWLNGPEAVRHARTTQDNQDYRGIKFTTASSNAVINRRGDLPFLVNVTLDGRPLTMDQEGLDIELADV